MGGLLLFLPFQHVCMKVDILDLQFLAIDHAIAVFLIQGTDGYVLIESGPYSNFAHLKDLLAQKGVDLKDIKHVLLSHIHFDHAGAAWAFAEAGAQVYVHPRGLPHLAAPEKLYNSARQIYGDQMDRLWGEMRPIPENQLVAPEHGAVLDLAGIRFTAWYTPGHAVHHIAWMAEPIGLDEAVTRAARVLFTGDVAGVKIDDGLVAPPCPPPDINLEDWRASIHLMHHLPVDTLYLTHFGKITDKQNHLTVLEHRLLEWANWMRPYAESGAPAEAIIPFFKEHVRDELLAYGVEEAGLARYEAANPAFMSVAGLLRYWKKQGVGPSVQS